MVTITILYMFLWEVVYLIFFLSQNGTIHVLVYFVMLILHQFFFFHFQPCWGIAISFYPPKIREWKIWNIAVMWPLIAQMKRFDALSRTQNSLNCFNIPFRKNIFTVKWGWQSTVFLFLFQNGQYKQVGLWCIHCIKILSLSYQTFLLLNCLKKSGNNANN